MRAHVPLGRLCAHGCAVRATPGAVRGTPGAVRADVVAGGVHSLARAACSRRCASASRRARSARWRTATSPPILKSCASARQCACATSSFRRSVRAGSAPLCASAAARLCASVGGAFERHVAMLWRGTGAGDARVTLARRRQGPRRAPCLLRGRVGVRGSGRAAVRMLHLNRLCPTPSPPPPPPPHTHTHTHQHTAYPTQHPTPHHIPHHTPHPTHPILVATAPPRSFARPLARRRSDPPQADDERADPAAGGAAQV